MNPIVVHIISGHSFFTGSALVLLALKFRQRCIRRWQKRLCFVALFSGLLMVLLSGKPVSISIPVVLFFLTVAACNDRIHAKFPRLIMIAMASWVMVAACEIPTIISPRVPVDLVSRSPTVVVVADSMTAGLGEGEATTWPELLRGEYSGDVMDISHVGETFRSATKRVRSNQLPATSVVIVELGGNDILGSTTVEEYEQDVDAFLASVTGIDRHVYMFELPLLPFHNRWGKIQRSLAAKHNVALIPKHRLASVLAGKSSTLDSIHLSQEGHHRMLQIVGEILNLADNRTDMPPDPNSD